MKIEGRPKNISDDNSTIKDNKMNNNFVLISLEEKGAKKIAEAINNDTGRKILDYLANKECTESELSTELKIPISTIHYNLKQLVDANLVVVDEFHYSKKGKEINHYKLANKYIIIAPKQKDNKFMDALQKILPLTVITAIAGGVLLFSRIISGVTNGASKSFASEVAPNLMIADSAVSTGTSAVSAKMATPQTIEVARPFLQSEMITWFFIGALSIIVIYFVYELVRKKK